jgi:glucokinase
MNDLEAMAFAVPSLRADDVRTINVGAPVPKDPIAVIAPGTGLGESFLTWEGSRYITHAPEGGHCGYAPTDETQLGLLAFIFNHFQHVSYEPVCSGIGLPHIYEYLRSSGYAKETPEVAQDMAAANDPSPTIMESSRKSRVNIANH